MSNTLSFSNHLLGRKNQSSTGLLEFNHFAYMWSRAGDDRLIASHTVYNLLETEPFSIFFTVGEFRKYIHPEDLDILLLAEEKLLFYGKPLHVEYRIVCKNGKEKHIRHHMQLTSGIVNSDIKITSILDDITEQKRADIILEIMNEVFFEIDGNDVIRRVNKKAELYWEKNKQDLIGKNILDFLDASREAPLFDLIKQTKEKKRGLVQDILSPQKRWVHASVTPSNDGVIVLIYDIHDEKEAAYKLHDSEAQWRRLVHNTPDIITRWDTELKLIYANPLFEEKMGIQISDMLGKNSLEVGQPEEIAVPWMDKLRQVMTTKKPLDYFNFYATPHGNFYFYSRLVPECDDGQNILSVLSIARDITELREREQQIKKMNESLIRKNAELEERHKELASLSHVTSHDLKEPLRKIYTAIEWIMSNEAKKLSDGGRANFRRLQSSVQKMGLISDDLLSFVNVSAYNVDRQTIIDLNTVLEESKKKLGRSIAEKNAKIASTQLPAINGNMESLVQLFQNIINNAIKFQLKNNAPVVEITSSIVKKENDDGGNNYLMISFTDNGIGFNNDHAGQLFNLFTKFHNPEEFRGNGMGLAVCKKIMEQHNGFMKASSEEGKGSTFSCFFPI